MANVKKSAVMYDPKTEGGTLVDVAKLSNAALLVFVSFLVPKVYETSDPDFNFKMLCHCELERRGLSEGDWELNLIQPDKKTLAFLKGTYTENNPQNSFFVEVLKMRDPHYDAAIAWGAYLGEERKKLNAKHKKAKVA